MSSRQFFSIAEPKKCNITGRIPGDSHPSASRHASAVPSLHPGPHGNVLPPVRTCPASRRPTRRQTEGFNKLVCIVPGVPCHGERPSTSKSAILVDGRTAGESPKARCRTSNISWYRCGLMEWNSDASSPMVFHSCTCGSSYLMTFAPGACQRMQPLRLASESPARPL